MLTPPVTVKELENALEAADLQQIKTLLQVCRHKGEELTTEVILKLCVVDWLLNCHIVDFNLATRLILVFEEELRQIAERHNNAATSDCHQYSVLMFADFKFAACCVNMDVNKGWYDLKDGAFIASLPQHSLTSVSCDLNVLLLRLRGMIKRIREIQEKIHGDTATAENSPGNPDRS